MHYVSYDSTRNAARTDFPKLVGPGDRIAVKIVASLWENASAAAEGSGRFWAAYCADGEKPNDEIADHGIKVRQDLAELLFPQIVAAGYEWWD